jgi:hypothetical protein
VSAASIISQGFGSWGSVDSIIKDGFGTTGVTPPTPTPEAAPQTAGSSGKKKHKFSTIYKDDLYLFKTLEELQDFVRELHPEEGTPRKKRPLTKLPPIEVSPLLQSELFRFDLPDIQRLVDEQRFAKVAEVLERLDFARVQLEMIESEEDEDLLLLA